MSPVTPPQLPNFQISFLNVALKHSYKSWNHPRFYFKINHLLKCLNSIQINWVFVSTRKLTILKWWIWNPLTNLLKVCFKILFLILYIYFGIIKIPKNRNLKIPGTYQKPLYLKNMRAPERPKKILENSVPKNYYYKSLNPCKTSKIISKNEVALK